MICLALLDVVRISFEHISVYQLHQIPLVCDHQELACTPKDPPRRVVMQEMSQIVFIRKCMELSPKQFENLRLWNRLKTAYVLFYLNTKSYMN